MFLVDTHCHLNAEYFPDGLHDVYARALENDVRRLVFASSDVNSSLEAAALAAGQTENPEVWALAGVHPHESAKAEPGYLDELEELMKQPRVLGIGEIGLDYFYDLSPRDAQRRVFIEQIELAKKLNCPIALHIRDAKDRESGDANSEAIKILRQTGATRVGGIVHCFSGTMQNALDALELGFYISFAGPITYPKNMALREIAMEIPIDRILCETDSPYLAPQGFRGKPNEPCHVRAVYEMVSMLKCVPLDELAEIVRVNGERAYKMETHNV